jgi:hypothetical protein
VTTASWPEAGPWVEKWLSEPRLRPYLRIARNDLAGALAVYEWNARVSAALLHDLAHLEVAIRNAYDRAINARWRGAMHWTLSGAELFAPIMRTRGHIRVDINKKNRQAIERAIESAGGPAAPAGKVVAELMLGFWRYLTSKAHEKALWVPYLHHAFPRGTDRRRDIDQPVGRLHDLRNRVVHHEPVCTIDLQGRLDDVLAVAGRVDPRVRAFIRATTAVPDLLASRP